MHPQQVIIDDLVETILDGFARHFSAFRALSRQAKRCFDAGDWEAARGANRDRIKSYDLHVKEVVAHITEALPPEARAVTLWSEVKRTFSASLFDHRQPECAETFYNSVACGVLHRRYYRNDYIFFRPAISTDYLEGSAQTYRCYYPDESGLAHTLYRVLSDLDVGLPFRCPKRDVECIVAALSEKLGHKLELNFQLHILSSLFYRNKAAYVVGRIVDGDQLHPFVLPLLRDRTGRVFADALLLDPRSIGLVFSLARAYFMVDCEVPAAYVTFLRTVIPTKSRAEIYVMLGLQKQGKTLFYRDMQQHLTHSTDSFVLAPGQRGMVMAVFTLPSFPYVFKVIRDWFEPPKDADSASVKEKYLFVKHHDRVGRMSDCLEYSNVGLPKARFSPELRAELARVCPSMVEEDGDTLVIKHAYIERRLTPLDIYLSQANGDQARAALQDLGCALRELTAVNIFPGDLPLKNFGVTRFGKVVFYDYDEIGQLTELNFRALPVATSDHEELASEPWFHVGPRDVFPEEFPRFIFRDPKQRALFLALHGDLATPAFWRRQQDKLRSGDEDSVYPYPQELRFRVRFGGRAPSTP